MANLEHSRSQIPGSWSVKLTVIKSELTKTKTELKNSLSISHTIALSEGTIFAKKGQFFAKKWWYQKNLGDLGTKRNIFWN